MRPTRFVRPARRRRSAVSTSVETSKRLRLAAGLLAGALPLAIWLGTLMLAAPAAAQLLLLPADGHAPVFEVSHLELVHGVAHPGAPDLGALLPLEVELRRTETGFAAPIPDAPRESVVFGAVAGEPIPLEASGLAATLRTLVARVHELGFYGVDVRPAESDIDLETERDLRPDGRRALRVVITIGRIGQLRTIAVGDRIPGDWKIDHEDHEPIRAASPLQPASSARDAATDLLDRRALEDYLHRLNRHPGRRVEAALSPDETPGEVVLDYRVFEAKPWSVYAQASNTGTQRTQKWQTRVGFVHRQLTGRDDILSLEYLNAGLDVNGVRAAYEAPFFSSERPDWMNRRAGDPSWLDWIPREKIPWWGVDGLRWGIDFSYGRFEASPAAGIPVNDTVVSEQINAGAKLVYTAFQHRNLFLDVSAGLRFRNVAVDNQTIDVEGEELFVLPRLGLRAERISAISKLGLGVGVEGQIAETDRDQVRLLGRAETDARFAVLDFDLGWSSYLEPLLRPAAFRDTSTRLSSTLAHEIAIGVRGQYAFDYRLVPQSSQILGGLYSVRGYRQSQAVGDSVFIGSFEYRFHVPRWLPIRREPLAIPLLGDFRATPQQVYGRPDWDFVLRAFVDVGRSLRNANNVNVPAGGGGVLDRDFEDDDFLLGVGVGAELQIRSNLRARVDWATPLEPAANRDPQDLSFGDKHEIHLLFSVLY